MFNNPENQGSGTAEAFVKTMENLQSDCEELRKRLFETQKNLLASENKARLLEQKLVEQTKELTESNLVLQQNIDALKQSKQRLREREARLNSIFNAAAEGIITIDREGRVVSANTAVKAILGYSEAKNWSAPADTGA